jgi:mRNA interferase RelE/StbE
MYAILFSQKAIAFLDKLDQTEHLQIRKALEKIRIRPEAFLIRLVGEELYKLRVGDYRLYLDLQKEKLILLVLKIGHRKNVYKRN